MASSSAIASFAAITGESVRVSAEPALPYYADYGWAKADSKNAENALQTVSLGRNNFLFFGSNPVMSAKRCCTA